MKKPQINYQANNIFNTFFKVLFVCTLYLFCMINIDIYSDKWYVTPTNRIMEIIYIFCLWHLVKWRKHINEKRVKIISGIAGGMLALCYVLGYNIEIYNDLFGVNEYIYWRLIFKWFALSYIISSFLLKLFLYIKNLKPQSNNIIHKFLGTTRGFITIIIFLFIAWLPSFINNFPGILLGDSYNHIYQALGIEKLSTHHPITYIMLIKLCLSLGGNIDQGVLLYTLISMTTIIIMLSYIIYKLAIQKRDIRIIIAALLIFMFYPSIQIFALSMLKDGIWAAFVGCFELQLIDAAEYYKENPKKEKVLEYIKLFIFALGVALFRNNGIYLLLFSAIFILFYKFKIRYKFLYTTICIIPILIFIFINHPLVNYLGIAHGSPREMLSLPIQQMARIDKNIENLDPELKREIYSYFKDHTQLGENYYPLISDYTKQFFSTEKFEKNKLQFIKTTVKLLLKFPEESLEAYMCNSYGYWYPTEITWFCATNNTPKTSYIKYIDNHEYGETVNFIYFAESKKMPIIFSLTSIGLIFWLLLSFLFYIIYIHKYNLLLIYMPMLALWLTSVASPVYNEQRYILSIYIVTPIIISEILAINETNNKPQLGRKEHEIGQDCNIDPLL